MINLFGAVCMLTSHRVNFINILKAILHAQRSQKRKKDLQLDCLFFSSGGSALIKAACRTLMKLTLSVRLKWRKARQTNCRKLNLKIPLLRL